MISKEAREKLLGAIEHLVSERNKIDEVIATIHKLLDEGISKDPLLAVGAGKATEVALPKRPYNRAPKVEVPAASANGKPVENPDEKCTRCKHMRRLHIHGGGKCAADKCWCGGFVGLANFAETAK